MNISSTHRLVEPRQHGFEGWVSGRCHASNATITQSSPRRLARCFGVFPLGAGLENGVGDEIPSRTAHHMRDVAAQLILRGLNSVTAGAKASPRFDHEQIAELDLPLRQRDAALLDQPLCSR